MIGKYTIGLKELRENVENEHWEKVIDFTKLRKGGVNIDELLNRL